MPTALFHTYRDKIRAAAKRVDTDASHAQREALNARVGKVFMHGLEIAIEHPKGSTRKGVGKDGKEWSRKMNAHYGRIARTKGLDGDPVDVFIGDDAHSQLVFVIDQLDAGGNLDEHKCMMGVHNVKEAKELYLSHYPEGWAEDRLGQIRGMFMKDFKTWLRSSAPVKNSNKKKANWIDAYLAELRTQPV